MDSTKFREEFYQSVLEEIKQFSKSEQAKNIYAIVFDTDEFHYVLRFQTISNYEDTVSEYIDEFGNPPRLLGFDEKYFSDKSLIGFKYAVGDFNIMNENSQQNLSESPYVKDIFNSIAYYECDYIEDKSRLIPRAELPENFNEFLLETCLYCVERLKTNLNFLDKTDDFIIFVTEHDVSNDRKLELISKTVDSDLFKKLMLNNCDI